MAYYHELVTQESWEELQKLRKLADFVLIGGWATYLYTRGLKSKDIDILVNYNQLPKLDKEYDLYKNERLKKYEAVKGEVQIDIYLPHFSQIGIPVETLVDKAKSVEGFGVLEINYLVALKIFALQQRGRSLKGRKDMLDIISLIQLESFDYKKTRRILRSHKLEPSLKTLNEMLSETSQIQELNLNTHKFSKVKKEMLVGFDNFRK